MTGPGRTVFGGGSFDAALGPAPDCASRVDTSADDSDAAQRMLSATTVNIAYRAALQTTAAIRHVSLADFLR